MASVTILYFASLREQLGREGETAAVAAEGESVTSLLSALRAQDSALNDLFERTPRIRAAINQALAGFQDTVRPGDELAFFPPMTGG
ncbi:MoaD/ThiS family protein [Acetobacter senegalensis]|uniref:MoaD/ThiS family protein n=1 Tax=Acetobacter senegalensis TaxID=446692 RepID=UPI00264AC654|nr:MoaD/ThiS family protein [Acetobacter senegalensis]MDN7350836.1 MoaD/ThiS family protein [Acetobacter senegalensis]